MKKIKRDVVVTLTIKTSRVEKIKCNCTVGASSYCNRMMTLLFGIADYLTNCLRMFDHFVKLGLKGLTEVPQEVYCTSQARKWRNSRRIGFSFNSFMHNVVKWPNIL